MECHRGPITTSKSPVIRVLDLENFDVPDEEITRPGEARQGLARQGKARQGEARQGKEFFNLKGIENGCNDEPRCLTDEEVADEGGIIDTKCEDRNIYNLHSIT